MQVITPVFLDICLFYCCLDTGHRLKISQAEAGVCIALLASLSSLAVNTLPKIPFIQLFVYLLIMPLIDALFYGNKWIKAASYLKLLLVLTILNLLSAYMLNQIKCDENENSSFIIFVVFTIITRLLVYIFLKERRKQKKINYFEIISCRYILIKAIISIILLFAHSYIVLNEEMFHTEMLWNLRVILLVILVVLVISIFEDIETEAQKIVENMRNEQQMDIERNYLNAITRRTQELAKIRHDIKEHIFMIYYLAEKDDIQGIKDYLGKIPVVEGSSLITVPQKEWLGALIYSKAEKAKKVGVEFDFENQWNPELVVMVDNMDILSLTANILDNAIEAAQKVMDKKKKKVKVVLNQNRGYLLIDVWNHYNKSYLDIVGNRFKTTKKDKQLHGKGIEIIRETAAKYKGDFSYDMKEDEIVTKITIQNIMVR